MKKAEKSGVFVKLISIYLVVPATRRARLCSLPMPVKSQQSKVEIVLNLGLLLGFFCKIILILPHTNILVCFPCGYIHRYIRMHHARRDIFSDACKIACELSYMHFILFKA